ncbi:IS200/IS605 family transposase [Roseivirga sp. BDSF3-8]|uniref:IS200/IS605 family transposase n=1 Tax=Roseivirga sp. BDSF3-8 TaxID=3241598 RepID=UPI003531D940
MSKYRKLSHSFYYCVYHVVWTPKYRHRILRDIVADTLENKIKTICEWKEVKVEELNIQPDHVHLVCSIPPKLSVSDFMGILKGKTAIMMFKNFKSLRRKPYWGNPFWSRGYFVSTVGIDEEKIKRYVKYQEKEDKKEDGDIDIPLFDN